MKFGLNPIADNNIAYFPKKYANQGVAFYLLSLAACTLLFMSNAMPIYILIMGIVSVLLFFMGSNSLGRQWSKLREKAFLKKLFWWAFAIRLVYIVVAYIINKTQYGTYCESNSGDIHFYVPTVMQGLRIHGFNIFAIVKDWFDWDINLSDMGYMIYLAIVIGLIGGSGAPEETNVDIVGQDYIWFPLILKALWGALTCVLMYKVARRHFGENVGRITAIFCMLQMNMIWWCGSMMKETEMVFLSCLFVERMDRTISGFNLRPWFIASTVAIGLALFTFRSALFMTAFAATILAVVLTRSRGLTMGKKVLTGIMVAVALSVAIGDNITNELTYLTEKAQDTEYQRKNMEWRANSRENSNEFARYATATVFAPLIFTIPFPNMVYTYRDQEMLMQVNGGNFEKNVLSFFIIFAMLQLLFSGQWRQHVFPTAYYVGYLAALVFSVFAQSGRFHMPILPFAMMFGAYGLTLVSSRKHKQWFTYALVAEVGICIFWGWFKLKGQGLI